MGHWASTAAILTLLLFLGACSRGSDKGSDSPSLGGLNLPLTVGRSKSDLRATISTTIGGATQSLLFDTGSTGLTVLSTAVPDSIASMTGSPIQESFGDGVLLTGVMVSVPVEIAGNATNGPIMIRLIQSATCGSTTPNCSAKDGIGAFAKSIGADGIFGAGLWSDNSVFSPLTQLAWGTANSIAVTWDGTAGSVTINPVLSAPAVATVQMPAFSPASLPNGNNAWNNLAVPICWQIESAPRTCLQTSLDTGASALSFPIDFPGGPTTNVKELAAGQRVSAAVSDTAPPFLDFTTGKKLGKDLVTVIPGQSAVDSGVQFFNEFLVVFSLTNGAVTLLSSP